MRSTRHSFVPALFAALLIAACGWFTQPNLEAPRAHAAAYGQLTLSYTLEGTRAKTYGAGYSVALTGDVAVIRLPQRQPTGAAARFAEVKLQLVNAQPHACATPLDPLPGRVNYLRGNDPQRWRTNLPSFARVKYAAVYPGVDAVWYGKQRQLEYDFIVAPGADPRQIELAFDGIERLELDAAGELLLHTAAGTLRQHHPFVYQAANGTRRAIAGRYIIRNPQSAIRNQTVGFEIGAYDPALALVIDPVLSYGTYLGGTGQAELCADIAVDGAGQAYVVGSTASADFPTANPAQGSLRGNTDVIVAKLNASGNALVYSTFLGGANSGQGGEIGFGIAADANGNAYVTGLTSSTDFPTRNAFDSTLSGPVDAFLTKFDAAGRLVYSTFLGGGNAEIGFDVAVDSLGAAYVVGNTNSTDLNSNVRVLRDETPNEAEAADELAAPEQTGLRGPSDGFIMKLTPNGGARSYVRYLGGDANELAFGVAVDEAGSAYVIGNTDSRDFPTVNPVQANYAGGDSDAFVTKVAVNGGSLVYSTYLGGSGDETSPFLDGNPIQGLAIAVDRGGSAYVTGRTGSRDFPLRNPLRATFAGNSEAYVTKLNASGNALVYSTFIGGSGDEEPTGIAVDAQGNAYVAGATDSGDFPQVNALPGSSLRGEIDAYLVKLNAAGSALVYATFYGGGDVDLATGVAVDAQGNAYLCGITGSGDLPTNNPLQAALRSNTDLFVAKLAESGGGPVGALANVSAASFNAAALAPESVVAAFGNNLATSTEAASAVPLPTALAGTTVTVRDAAGREQLAPLFFVAPAQVNYVLPPVATGPATITITSGNGQISRGTVTIRSTAPGLFTANASGAGLPAAVLLRQRANGEQVYEQVAQFNGSSFVAVPLDFGAPSDQLFLVMYGTGMRLRANATASVGGLATEIQFLGASSLIGVDQCNLRLSRALAGRGEVEVVLTVDGTAANRVRVSFR